MNIKNVRYRLGLLMTIVTLVCLSLGLFQILPDTQDTATVGHTPGSSVRIDLRKREIGGSLELWIHTYVDQVLEPGYTGLYNSPGGFDPPVSKEYEALLSEIHSEKKIADVPIGTSTITFQPTKQYQDQTNSPGGLVLKCNVDGRLHVVQVEGTSFPSSSEVQTTSNNAGRFYLARFYSQDRSPLSNGKEFQIVNYLYLLESDE